jgi:hypothetical protein
MKLDRKLLPGSIVALLLGVFLAAPLLYTNIVMAPPSGGSKPLLGVEVTYAYIEQITGIYVSYGGFLPDSENPNATESGLPRTNYFVALNLTRLSEDFDSCDAKFMIYLIKFYSDKEFIGNMAQIAGVIYNSELEGSPFRFDPKLLLGSEFFGNQSFHQAGGSFGKWAVGESRTSCSSGFWDSNFEEPEIIFASVNLLGWITLRGNSTDSVILEEPEVVTEIQMEKFGDGFLYNTLISEDELSELDPLNPLWKLFGLNGKMK